MLKKFNYFAPRKKQHCFEIIFYCMISKSTLSQIRLLHHKKHREEQGLFIVEGVKSCLETLHSDYEIVQCYATERFESETVGAKHSLPPKTPNIISEKEMSRISCLTTPSEILCIVKSNSFQLDDLDETKPLLVLDSISDPGNLGTIIRTADWFGFHQILCSETCVEFTNPKVIQATMGSFTRIKVVYFNLIHYLKTQNHRTIYGLCMNGEPVQKQSFHNNDIIILGSESHGISESLFPFINQKITIPGFPHDNSAPESLNAAIAAGIFMYAFSIMIG